MNESREQEFGHVLRRGVSGGRGKEEVRVV